MTVVSFRRNLRKYSLAVLSLALAVTVSCLGLSGVELLQRSTLKPLTFIAGGQVMLIDSRTNLRPAGSRLYADPLEIKPYPEQWAETVLGEAGVRTEAVSSLVAPFMRYAGRETTAFYVAARDHLPESLSGLRMIRRDLPSADMPPDQMVIPGYEWTSSLVTAWYRMELDQVYPLTIPKVMPVGQQGYDWDVAAGEPYQYTVSGIYDQESVLYPLFWTTIGSLRSQVGEGDYVSWVGIDCRPEQMDSLKAALEVAVAKHGLPLRVFSLLDLGQMLIGDFERFEQMADYYSPVMLFVAVQIVLVNAVALAMTRRKELTLLRTIGLSQWQIQLMFVGECIATSIAGGLLGTGMASVVALVISQSPLVSLTPFAITLVTTSLVSVVMTAILTGGSLSKTLRNPLGE